METQGVCISHMWFWFIKLGFIVGMMFFWRAILPFPLWVPVWCAMAWVVAFRVNKDNGAKDLEPTEVGPVQEEPHNKPHWGKFK